MNVLCTDNRFELIAKYKNELIEGTNIETSEEEMKVIDTILFRFWQMGWLDKLEEPQVIRCKGCKWWEREAEDSPMGYCHACKHGHYSRHWEIHIIRTYEEDFFCADAERREEE